MNGGQRALAARQKAGSSFAPGVVPAFEGGQYSDFPGKPGYSMYEGFAINKVMNTDFTLVIKTDVSYSIVSMAYRSTYFDPTLKCAVYNPTRSFWAVYANPWGWDGNIGAGFTTFGDYGTTAPNTGNLDRWYEFKRVGEALTIKSGSSAGSITTTLITATCGVNDYVGCLIGSGSGGSYYDIVSFAGTPATPS